MQSKGLSRVFSNTTHIWAIKISKKQKMGNKDWGRILFEDVLMEKFPNFVKSFKSPIQEAQ